MTNGFGTSTAFRRKSHGNCFFTKFRTKPVAIGSRCISGGKSRAPWSLDGTDLESFGVHTGHSGRGRARGSMQSHELTARSLNFGVNLFFEKPSW